VRPKRLGLTSRVVYEQVVNNVDKSDMFLKYILLFVYVVLTPSVLVSNCFLRPRVRLFICLLQGVCTLDVVQLRRVVTRITSGVYERVHSISRRTLYYITPPRFLRGLGPNKSYIAWGGFGGYLFECISLFKKFQKIAI
jgi:hypothetical protein